MAQGRADTVLDLAHAAMLAAPGDDQARLAFYERLADGELFLLLEREPEGDAITPQVVTVDGQDHVLAFDREDRLAEFAGRTAAVAGLAGRALAAMLAGQGIGIALNPDVAPSAMLIDAEAVDWLAATLAQGPVEAQGRPVAVHPPHGLPETVVAALDRKLAMAAGLARAAWLVGVEYEGGARSHMLAFVEALPGAEAALAAAVGEALTFSGIEAGVLDVTFLRASDAFAARLARVGLRFDLPEPEAPVAPGANPGMDPDRPPRLR
ncbi:MAG: SseB family protein [Rhodobacterales bacterium]|nr:SseB family protein [Rhodobacterales bacterium]NCT13391.1 SseB family protein [Rhodobacterales bacterium]